MSTFLSLRAARGSQVPVTPRDALKEALSSPGGGEVVIRSGDVAAWIHVQDGHIVWANVSSAPATMDEVTRHGGLALENDTMLAVKEESRATGAHFMEVLVRWGLIGEDRAREAVRAFVGDRVKIALELPDAVGLFLPKVRAHSGRLRFRASEIPSLRDPGNLLPRAPGADPSQPLDPGLGQPLGDRTPPLPLLEIARIVREAAAMEGSLGAAVLDRRSGACLHHSGADVDTKVAWAQMGALEALGPDAEEVLATAGERCFVTRPLRGTPSLVLFAAVSLASTTLGFARVTVAAIASRAVPCPPASIDLDPPPPPSAPRPGLPASQEASTDDIPESPVTARAGGGSD